VERPELVQREARLVAHLGLGPVGSYAKRSTNERVIIVIFVTVIEIIILVQYE